MALNEEVRLLREAPLFAGVAEAHLQVLAFSAGRFKLAAGDYLVRQGEQGDSAWLIRRGAAEAFHESAGRTRKVARLERGALVGELAMIARLPHRLSVRAISPLSGLRIDNGLFMRVCGEFPEFGQQVLHNLATHFSHSMGELQKVRELFSNARSFGQA